MKNTVIILTVLILSILVSTSTKTVAHTGESQTSFGNYTITPVENMVVIDNVAYKTYNLTYDGSNETYTVMYSPKLGGACCITVRNQNFEIQYSRVDGKFGIKLVDPSMRTIKRKQIMNQIDYDQFVSQLVLTTGEKTENEYLGLVACYLPMLFS